MKPNAVALGLVCVLFALVPAVTSPAQQLPDAVAPIVEKVQGIDRGLDEAPARTKSFSRGNEAGFLSYYRGENEASKLVVELVSEGSGTVVQYYYEAGRLIYAVDVCKCFTRVPAAGIGGPMGTITENRLYLSGGHLVGWLAGTGNGAIHLRSVDAGNDALVRKGAEVRQNADLLRAFAASPETDLRSFRETYLNSASP